MQSFSVFYIYQKSFSLLFGCHQSPIVLIWSNKRGCILSNMTSALVNPAFILNVRLKFGKTRPEGLKSYAVAVVVGWWTHQTLSSLLLCSVRFCPFVCRAGQLRGQGLHFRKSLWEQTMVKNVKIIYSHLFNI